MNSIDALNIQLFLAMNGGSGAAPWLVALAKAVGDGLIYLIPALLVALWLSGSRELRGIALRSFLVVLFALGVNQIIGLGWQHPRPFTLGLGHAWIEHAPDSSFPSDHATIFFGVAFTLILGGALRLSLVVFVIAFAVAWARVFLGVHFPFDMVGAFVVAIASWAMTGPVWSAAGARLTQLAESVYHRLFAWPISIGWINR